MSFRRAEIYRLPGRNLSSTARRSRLKYKVSTFVARLSSHTTQHKSKQEQKKTQQTKHLD